MGQIACGVLEPDDLEPKSICDEVYIPDGRFVNALPRVNVDLAFHFISKPSGQNFVDIPVDGNSQIDNGYKFVADMVYYMNETTSDWVDLNYSTSNPSSEREDGKLSLNLVDDLNSSVYFYNFGQTPIDVNGALDVIFLGTEEQHSSGEYYIYGYTNFGRREVFMQNAQRKILGDGDTNSWNWGRGVLHEYLHTQRLYHSFTNSNECNGVAFTCLEENCNTACAFNDGEWGCSELTMAYGEQFRLTTCELSRMWIDNLDVERDFRTISCEPHIAREVVMDEGGSLTWDSRVVMDADLRLTNNTELTINCQVLMGDERKIIVEEGSKLILDGGTITSLCDGRWRGIKVYGGSGEIAVETKNNAIIENTKEAAVSMFATGGWLLGNGNAIVNLDNTTFNNCKRVLAMGSRTFEYNPTVVNHCTQNNGKWGVTNWNCYGVQVTNNTFFNISKECVVTDRGQYNIYNNTIYSQEADILFANVSPGIGNNIELNQLNGAYTGVRSLGASLGDNQIIRNQLFADEYDVFMDGDNHYTIKNNDITADFGVVSVNNSIYANTVAKNHLNGSVVGLLPDGLNDGYIFYENCFETSYADTYIEGKVSAYQINPLNQSGANNCFTHNGEVNSNVYDITGNPDQFTYVEPNDNVVDCQDAVKAHANVTRAKQGPPTNTCTNAGTGNGIFPEPLDPCNPKKDIKHTWQAIQWLNNRINEIANDPNLTPKQKARLISIYQRCLNRVQGLWKDLMFKAGRYDKVRTYYAGQGTDEAILSIYASYIAEADYASAKEFLNDISRTDEHIQDYIWVQLLDIKRLENDLNYTATPMELQDLETIAHKTHPFAGYAKALYYWLTETIIESELPQVIRSIPRSETMNDDVVNVDIYPNPFDEMLNVSANRLNGANIIITDLLGREVFQEKIRDDQFTINTSEWPQGIYLSTFYEDGKIVYQKKLVLVK